MTDATDAELGIRLRRAAFNRALVEADLAIIGTLLAPDVVMITGSDSAVIAGRKAQLAAWKREFAQGYRTVYIRTTERIIPSTAEPIAMEHGHWSGTTEGALVPYVSGTYAAKWRKQGSLWLVVAEVFVTLTLDGAA